MKKSEFLEIKAQAEERAWEETQIFVRFLRFYHTIMYFNGGNRLTKLTSGAIRLPEMLNDYVYYAFNPKEHTVAILFQKDIYECLDENSIKQCWIEPNGSLTIHFSTIRLMNFILPPLIINFVALSLQIKKSLANCDKLNIGLAVIDEDKVDIGDMIVINLPIQKSAPKNIINQQSGHLF